MKYIIMSLALISIISCGPNKTNNAYQFTISQQDNTLHCPKCGSALINSLTYNKEDNNGSGDIEHFDIACRQCGFQGWASLQDGKQAVENNK